MGGVMMDNAYAPEAGMEQEDYTEIIENDFIKATEQPSSYFSIDANTASYPNLRSLINYGADVPKDAALRRKRLQTCTLRSKTTWKSCPLSTRSTCLARVWTK